MQRKPVIVAIVILVLAIIGVWCIPYLKDMPRVSADKGEEVLSQYKESLQQLYDELNTNYAVLKEKNDSQQWDKFSRDWMPRLLNSKPELLEKKMPEECENKKAILEAAAQTFIPLWNEYNKDFIGKQSDAQKIGEYKNRIEEIFNNLDL